MRLVTGAWLLGSVWATATAGAPLTELARVLGASPLTFGVIAALPFIASLAALPASVLTERIGRRKPIFLLGLGLSRVVWFLIAIVPAWLWTSGHRAAALYGLLGLLLVSHTLGNCGGPAWVAWMGQIVPGRVRGAYFARRRQLGTLTALPAALAVGWALDRYAVDPATTVTVVAWTFGIAAIFGLLDILLFLGVPEPPTPGGDRGPLLGTLAGPLKDKQFLIFSGFVATLVLGSAPAGNFITLYLIEEMNVRGLQVQLMLLVAPNLAQLMCFGLWGRVVDRMGKKPAMAIGAAGMVPMIVGWIIVGHIPGGVWLGYALTMLGAVSWAAVETANFNYVLEFAGRQKGAAKQPSAGSGYAAVNGVFVNIAGIVGGLLFGLVAKACVDVEYHAGQGGRAFGYFEILFAMSAVLRLASLVWLPFLVEDRARPAREAIRFMTANLYNNVQIAVLQPVRWGRLRVRETLRQRG